MMKILNFLRNIIFIVILFGVASAYIDYTRMVDGSEPIFNISTYNKIKHVENYRGLFYQASRKTKINDQEALEDSSEIKYFILTKEIDIPNNYVEKKFNFSMKVEKQDSCDGTSTLYYADLNTKIYTYCFNNLNVLDNDNKKEDTLLAFLKKDPSISEDIIQNMNFTGMYYDNTIEIFKSTYEFSDDNFVIYKCSKPYINDLYMVPAGISVMDDFCTYKDDDFKFIAEVEEEELDSETTDVKEKEIFYEDDSYYYEFDEAKKDRIFVVSPAVRLSPEKRYSLMDVLNNKMLTIEELEEKGLKFNKVAK